MRYKSFRLRDKISVKKSEYYRVYLKPVIEMKSFVYIALLLTSQSDSLRWIVEICLCK